MIVDQKHITTEHQNKLAELFQLIGDLAEIRLYEPARGKLILVLIMNDAKVAYAFPKLAESALANKDCRTMNQDQLRCHAFCTIAPKRKEWFDSFSLPGTRKPAYVHDIMLFPPNWQSELEELKQARNYYTTVNHGFVESLATREPLIRLVRS
jgi:hypothetical protein